MHMSRRHYSLVIILLLCRYEAKLALVSPRQHIQKWVLVLMIEKKKLRTLHVHIQDNYNYMYKCLIGVRGGRCAAGLRVSLLILLRLGGHFSL